jgi:dTDP-4-amino-4,6-dideoxygalactose transaminase
MNVPFMDLKRQYGGIKSEIDASIQQTIDCCAFVAGKKVQQFENNFAKYCGVDYAVGVSSGTSALYVALKALDIGKGDIVITVPFTFIATVEAITLTGARPVFVDIEKGSYTISIEKLRSYIEKSCDFNVQEKRLIDKKTNLVVRAIMPVHLYGQMADMDEIMAMANKYNLIVVEDAAQAHGATYKGRKAGTIGRVGCFSFYPSKNLGAFGQGGAVITKDADVAERVKMFIDHGQREKYQHIFEGWNYKMDGFQAAVLDVKLKHLDKWNDARRRHAKEYERFLKDIDGIVLPEEAADRTHVYHLYVVHVEDRKSLQEYLENANISSLIHYPIALHTQKAFKYLGYKLGNFPDAEKCAEGVLSLPMFPELTSDEIEYVSKKIKDWVKK